MPSTEDAETKAQALTSSYLEFNDEDRQGNNL